jgi:NAD(P)-dependent dehydrogenase (short-subunit alcohol dehydrogenase family)
MDEVMKRPATPPIQARTAHAVASGAPLLDGHTVLITGAAGGIGRAICRVLADAGAHLVLIDRDDASLDAVAADLRPYGRRVLTSAADASDRHQFGALVAQAEEELGPLDALVNCAGLWSPKPYHEIDAEDWRPTLAANLESAFVCCQAVLPAMARRRSGSIVNFASTAGEYGSISPAAHYAAAKGGVIGFTKSLAREAGPENVRVNAISPGPTDTPALGAATAEQREAVGARTLLGRIGRPEEIANGVLFLASPLSTFVTGHVLRVNGGSLL